MNFTSTGELFQRNAMKCPSPSVTNCELWEACVSNRFTLAPVVVGFSR